MCIRDRPLVTDPEFCARHLILPGENGKWDHRYASCNAKDGTALLGALAEEKYEKFSFSYIGKIFSYLGDFF